ncbi:HD domain-containing protein [Thermodesulfobacteriota bacterium]
MIDGETLEELESWYAEYVSSFRFDDQKHQRNVDLKDVHSRRVRDESVLIGESLHLKDEALRLAAIMGLFHDIGRFEQYARYKTFSDKASEDHAQLGVRVLRKTGVLNCLEKEDRDLILRAVGCHNRSVLPVVEACSLFTKLIRDADKLDILRLLAEYYRDGDRDRNSVIELDLPDDPEIAEGVCRDLEAKRIVKRENVKTLNDFKLLLVGWVFDINFPWTFHAVRERKYFESIHGTLPQSDKIEALYSIVQTHLEEKCGAVAE